MRNKFHYEQKLQKDKFTLKRMKTQSEIVGCQYETNVELTVLLQTVKPMWKQISATNLEKAMLTKLMRGILT